MAQGLYHRLEVLADARSRASRRGGRRRRARECRRSRRKAASPRSAPLVRSRSNMPNPPAHCAKRRNSAERCSSVSRRLAEAQGLAHALGERIELVGAGCGRGIRIGDGCERCAQGPDAARHFTAEANAAAAIASARAHASDTGGKRMARRGNEHRRHAPSTSRAATGTAINLVRIGPLRMRHPKLRRSPSRHLSAGSGAP